MELLLKWNILRPYLHDRPSQPWSEFSITDNFLEKGEKKVKFKGGKSKRLIKKRNKTKKLKTK